MLHFIAYRNPRFKGAGAVNRGRNNQPCLPPSFNLVLVVRVDDVDAEAVGAAALVLKARAAHAIPISRRVQAAESHQRHKTILPFVCYSARSPKARSAAIKRACSPVISVWRWH